MMLAKSFSRKKYKSTHNIHRARYLFCCVVFLTLCGCQNTPTHTIGTWKTVLSGDWHARLDDVHFTSETHGWAVGSADGQRAVPDTHASDRLNMDRQTESIILHTADGGENWNKQQCVLRNPLRDVFFRDTQEGWAVGERGTIIHTTDGGKTWIHVDSKTQHDLHSITVTKEICWVAGDWGTLLRSMDGGKSFEIQPAFFGNRSIKAVHFIDTAHGWCITSAIPDAHQPAGYIYRTQDGGRTWRVQFETKIALFSLHIVDRLTVWVVGDRRSIYRTTDGGRTWHFLTEGSNARHTGEYGQPDYLGKEPLHTFTLYDVDFVDGQHGWIVGDLGVVLYSASPEKSGERLWKHQRGGPRFHNSADAVLLAVDFVSDKLGWAVGESGTIIHTTNGGLTWHTQSTPSHLLFDLHITTDNTAYAVGDRGAILKTTDSGATWRVQDSRITECFGGTHFITPTRGWAVAEAGIILRTTNGGVIWQRQNSNTTQDLLSAYFLDENMGWCVGSAGEIIRTTDGGKTWSPQKSGVMANLFDVHFISEMHGWVVGLFGTLLYTQDGGQQWRRSTLTQHLAKMNIVQHTWLNGVHFVSLKEGWVVGVDGLIFHTDDGGKGWVRQDSNTRHFLYDVHFISRTEGWIVGKAGLVLHTTDGGTQWRPQRTDTRMDLTAVQMRSSTAGLITGQGGTILKYEVREIE